MAWLWLAILAAHPFTEARYLMLVGEVPTGEVLLRMEGDTYVYRSRQLFRGRERARSVRLAVDASGATPEGLVPEGYWLSRVRPPGCVTALEELSRRPERLCLFEGGRGGTIDGRAFEARWATDGTLQELRLPGARFVASGAPLGSPSDPFAEGFSVAGRGPVAELDPPAPGVRQVHPEATGIVTGLPEGARSENCLDLARARMTVAPHLVLVLGLVLESHRAWPHAWLWDAGTKRFFDPSAPSSVASGEPRAYLSFPSGDAGQLYLELLAGRRRVLRLAHPIRGSSK